MEPKLLGIRSVNVAAVHFLVLNFTGDLPSIVGASWKDHMAIMQWGSFYRRALGPASCGQRQKPAAGNCIGKKWKRGVASPLMQKPRPVA